MHISHQKLFQVLLDIHKSVKDEIFFINLLTDSYNFKVFSMNENEVNYQNRALL